MKHTSNGHLRVLLNSVYGIAFCVSIAATPLAAEQPLISISGGDFRSINSGSVTASGIFEDNAVSVVETFTATDQTETRDRMEYGPSIGDDCIGCVFSVSAQGAMIGVSSIADDSVSAESASQDTLSGGLSITDGSYTSENSGTVSASGSFSNLKMGSRGRRNSFGVNASGSSITLSTSSNN